MSKERRLGRGLAALLGEPTETEVADGTVARPGIRRSDASNESAADAVKDVSDERVQELTIRVDQIDVNPFQPRREFHENEITSLAESLKTHDLLQPVLVRRDGERWQLISGERRLRAARQAGWERIPARVKDADDRLVAELAIVENLQRKDLNPIEKALSFQRYLQQHHCTQDELGKRLKIDRSTIANLLRLLELPREVREALQRGTISAGHARALLPLGDERRQVAFCRQILEEGMSVRETERNVQEMIRGQDRQGLTVVGHEAGKPKRRTKGGQIASLEQDFRRALGAKVDIQSGRGGRGKIVIHFKSHVEFERLQRYLLDESVGNPAAGLG